MSDNWDLSDIEITRHQRRFAAVFGTESAAMCGSAAHFTC